MDYYYVYKTTNLINNKIYIGQRKTKKIPENDINYLGSGKLIKQSIEKHGTENFKKEIIELCDNKDELDEREIFWIKELNSRDKNIGYNITIGGGTVTGFSVSDDHKEKLRKLNTGAKRSQEVKDKISKASNALTPVTCPYCNFTSKNRGMMKRFHFENCKLAENPDLSTRIKSAETRLKSSISNKNRQKVECPHCGKLVNNGNVWHFDRCKMNPNRNIIKIYKCEICGFETSNKTMITRFHNDKCKFNENRNVEKYKCYVCGFESVSKTNIIRFHNENCKCNPERIKLIYKCDYCGFETESVGNITRWHNENCKHKLSNQ